MANHELVLGQNPDLALGQSGDLVIGQNHGLVMSHRHGLGLGHAHEDDLGLSQGHEHGLVLGHPHDNMLVLGHHHHHSHDEDHDRDHDYSSELALGQNHEVHLLTGQSHHDLVLSDNHELALAETHDLSVEPNLEQLSIMPCHELALQPALDISQSQMVVTPVLQTRVIVSTNHELHVGQEFPDVNSCRRALRAAAIACHFEIQTVKSDKTRFTAKCAAEGCPWRIHAARLPGVPTFTIRTINENHNCVGIHHLGHQQASVQWVASSVEESLRENPQYKMSMQWSTILVSSAERRVSEAIDRAHGYQVGRANEAEFEVVSPHEGTNIVDIRNRCCLCRGWQLYGLPCAHGVAALLFCRQNVHRYTESCFTVATYRKTYSQTIHPIPDRSLWKELSEEEQDKLEVVINPPKSLRPPGRPRKKRVRAEDRGRVKRVVHCSRCNQTGHFRTTCAAPI
ncbi:hypothetical protein KSP39_PZI021681 [Platanthera zijinensis]|uniref:SWIM-type domain-containing protein n=1 Tax=Platanthera zijinensis TaxID=2320716 RepID=A0AAP0AYT6_9ASPA